MSEWSALGYAITELGRDILPESVTGKGGEVPAKTSPLYLLASEIVDIVELSEQYRAEEEAAAEEGALIEASGYPDPKFESNGRY